MPTQRNPFPWSSTPLNAADFEAVYRDQLPRVYNFFRYRFGDNVLAEDLTAATFEKAWQKRDQYRSDLSALTTWIFTIARRIAIDHFRRPRVEEQVDENLHYSKCDNPEELVQKQSDLQRLNRLLECLSERERELVALKYGSGLSNRAIANMCRLSESNVGVILFRTVLTLRKEWESDNE